MIKLIITDVDGTLVPEGSHHIDPQYYDIISKLHDKGIIFVAASGRHLSSLKKLFAPVLDKMSFLSQNGSVILHNNEVILPQPFPIEWVRELWEDLSKYEGIDSNANTADYNYCPFDGTFMCNWLRDSYLYDIKGVGGWDKLPDIQPTMVTVFHPTNAAEFCKKELYPKWHTRVNLHSSGKTWIDLVMPQNGKDNALRTLCEQLGISPSEVIAFGDNLNDKAMLEYAGTGIAVSTAMPEVKAIADRIIPSFDENGVLHELKKIEPLCSE